MEGHWIWWIAGLAMLIAELFTGTFYLLVIAIALAAGGLVAYFDTGIAMQLVTAAAVGFAGALILRNSKFGRPQNGDSARDFNVNIDIGNRIVVANWDEHGRARVSYRGAQWDVQLIEGAPKTSGEHVIKEVRGSTLIVS
jgi:membrane protein implicated in regulation of membrane protease activity